MLEKKLDCGVVGLNGRWLEGPKNWLLPGDTPNGLGPGEEPNGFGVGLDTKGLAVLLGPRLLLKFCSGLILCVSSWGSVRMLN